MYVNFNTSHKQSLYIPYLYNIKLILSSGIPTSLITASDISRVTSVLWDQLIDKSMNQQKNPSINRILGYNNNIPISRSLSPIVGTMSTSAGIMTSGNTVSMRNSVSTRGSTKYTTGNMATTQGNGNRKIITTSEDSLNNSVIINKKPDVNTSNQYNKLLEINGVQNEEEQESLSTISKPSSKQETDKPPVDQQESSEQEASSQYSGVPDSVITHAHLLLKKH